MTKHNKQKKRNYQYSHAFADLPLTYQKALKSAIMDMVVSANSELQTHRQISPYSAVIAASRSLQTSSSSNKPAARVFAAVRAVNSFINLSRTGKPGVERLSNTDLLPVAHPLSTRSHTMNEASLRAARAQWLAADPRIDDSLRNLVAAAYSQAPGSVAHRHAFTRISVLPAGAVPRDIRIDADLQLTPIIAVLGLGGNSDAARSLRAKLQRRDRKGRFAEMGGGWSFKLRLPDGLFKTVSGRVVGASGTDAIEIEVTGSKDLDDGIYTMPSAKGESVKAVLPTKAVEELPDRDDAMDDVYVDSASLTRKDAPSGWKQLGKTQQKGRTLYSEYTSDDGYTVKREARQNAAGEGVEYGYSVRRMEAKDTDPFARDKKVMRSWSDVQKAVLADQDDYKRDLEALSPPADEPQFTVKNAIPKGNGVSIQFGLAEFEDDENFPESVKRANDLGGFVEVGPPDFFMGGDGTITVTFDKPRLTEEEANAFLGAPVRPDGAFYARFEDEIEREELFDELTKGGPGEPPDEPDEPPFTSPEAARDILEEGALTAEGILTDIDDADLDDLDDDDAKILEKVNKLSDSAQEALDNIDPVGSQLNDIYFDQARADLGELAELLSNATNPDMQDAGFVLKEAVDKYLSLPTIDFSGRRAELEVAVEPSALDGVVQEVNALLDSYDSGAVDASDILDLLGEAIDDVPNNDQIYNSLKKQVENVELRGFSIEKAKSNAEKSIRKLASEEGAVPYLTAEKTPSAPETNDPVDESLFDDTFITSDDSYKLNVFDQYSPRGRVDQDSTDYTDDPQILANSFTAENLQKALRQALIPSSDGDVAVGLGYLPFDGGDEAVPAAALYEALDFAGIDSDIVVAGIYDSALPEGSETNVERITMLRDDLDKIGGEDFNPADINTARDWEIKQAIKRNGELATPQRAALAVAQMTDAAKNEEKNPSIKEVADDLINRQNDPNLNEYSAENLGNVLDSYMPWSFSDSADEREAFRGFWGMLMSIDGGSTNDMDDKRPVQSTSGFRRAVYESVKRQSGGDEEVALAEYDRLISEYGGYPEWTAGKEAISDGDADIFSDQSSAGAFFRLMAASAKKNDVRLQRYIDVRKDDPTLQQYLTPGVVLPIDARSFTTRDEAAEDIVSLLKYPPNSETTHIVFEIQPNEGTSISFASVSWFSGEAEHIAWGNYEVDSTRRVEMGGRTDLTVVSLRQVAASGADADGGAADSDIFGPGDDAAVDTPAKPNVANWDKVGPQLGSNLGGTYEDPDGDIYYVKESKSLKHAENEALASAFYKELGVNAVDVRVGEADGAPRTVSPIVSTTGETLADRLNDREFIDKIGEDFAVDAWLGNYDVAGLVYDNIVVDNDGNPLRVDPGGALLFRARGAEKGDMFGDSVGEIDTLVDPDINPSASRVFGGMTEEQREASAQKLLNITPERIDQIIDSIVTDPGMAEGLKDRLKKRRADVLNRFGIEDSVLNMPEVAQRPTAPVDKSPESIEAFKDELARFAMDKAIAKGWNCEGGLTSAATNPCDLPSVNELISEATPTAAELAEPKARQLPSDEEVNNAFDTIFDDIETYLGSDWGLEGTDKSKYKKTRTKIEDIRERYDAGEITREETAAELAALRDEISASGGEPIAKEATAEAIDHIIKNLDGTIYDPVVVIDKDLPPPGSGLGLSKDKVTVIKPGMTVKSKDGVTYVVNRYDPANWNYVYVKPTDGSKEKIKSTKTLEIIGGEEGGGGGTPAAPEPGGPELPKAEAPKGAPKAPKNGPESDVSSEKIKPEWASLTPLSSQAQRDKYTRDIQKVYPKNKNQAIVDYVDFNMSVNDLVNSTLRGNDYYYSNMAPFSEEEKARADKYIADIDTVIDALPKIQKDTVVFRGSTNSFSEEFFEKYKVGDVVAEDSYTSTSLDKDVALNFANTDEDEGIGLLLEIVAPAGTKGIVVPAYFGEDREEEQEVILDRGTVFRIISMTDSQDEETPRRVRVAIIGQDRGLNKNYPKTKTKTPSAVEKLEIPFPDDMPLAPRAPEPPKSKKDKQQGVVGPGAAPVIIEDALPYTESGIAGTPSLADAFAYAASDAPNAAIVGSYAAIDSTDIEDMSVRVTRLQLFEKPEQITRMKFKLTAWAGEKLFKDIEDLKRNEYTTTQGVALEHISRKDTAVPAIKTDMKVYNNWRHGTTHEAALPNGVKIQFLRGASGSYTDHVFSRSVEDYDEVVNALNNYVIVDIPDGVDLNEVRSALNVAGVVDPRPSVEQDFRILIENRLISVLGGKTNASRNEARPEVRQEILSEVKTKYGIGVEDVYVGIGANGRIEMKVSKEKAAALAKEAKIEIAEHNLTVSAGFRPDPELAATKIADIIVGPNRALMSTLARWTEGVSSSGQSSETDMATGGADYVFFSPKDMTVTSSIGYGVSDASDATVTFDAVDLFTRLDFYANYVDTYGARSEENDNLKNAAPGGYELMFKDRVSTDMLKDIVVHTRVVPFLIEELKKRGITEINGRSVDEVVTVGGQGVVMEKEGAVKKFQTKLDENLKTRFGEDFSGAKKYKDWLNEDPSGRAKEYAPPVDENAVIAAVKDLNNEKQERVIVRLTNGAYLSYTRYTGAIGAPFTYEYQEIENDFPGWSYLASDEQSKGSN